MKTSIQELTERIGRFDQSVRFVRHWSACAADTGPEGFPEFDPIDVPDLLPFLYLLERDGERLRYRVSGDSVNQLFMREHTGRFFDDVVPQTPYRVVAPYFFRVLDGYCCIFKGFVILPNKQFIEFERVLLPITRQDRNLILGCASFSTTARLRRDPPAAPERGFQFHQVDRLGSAVERNWIDMVPLVDSPAAS